MATCTWFCQRRTRGLSGLFLALASLLVMPGCWVYSVEPLYEENLDHPDTDVVFDQSLVGSWWQADDDCVWTLTFSAPQKSEPAYEFTVSPAPDCKTKEKASRYNGHVVKLDSYHFLDVNPWSEDVCDLCLPLHNFFLISQQNDTLAFTPVDPDWLEEAFAQNKVTLAHLNDGLKLTASSKDLKAFVRKYANDEAVFKPVPGLTFKRK
jgi:hypothetical protein